MEFKHPKYYKELRKRNKPAGTGGALCVDPEAGSDQSISKESSTEENQRSTDPGPKLQASEDSTANSTRGRVAEPEATSSQASSGKRQAPSCKHQASSRKRQAP